MKVVSWIEKERISLQEGFTNFTMNTLRKR